MQLTVSKYILSDKANCQYCYKCLRNCPVKAISFKNNESLVIEEECVLCGTCVLTCPQNAKTYRKDRDKMIHLFGKPFVISIAPSFYAHFEEPLKILSLLRSLGAVYISETAIGAEYVTNEYVKVFQKRTGPAITTSCPVVVSLIEKHYPELKDYLLEVKSPALAHYEFLNHMFGSIPKIFVSPCIAKKEELDGKFDVVLTFEELEEIIEKRGFKERVLTSKETFPDAPYPRRTRIYPESGGIISSASFEGKLDSQSYILEGINNIIEFLNTFHSLEEKVLIEASACVGGCINGPTMRKDDNILQRRLRMRKIISQLDKLEGKRIDTDSIPLQIHRTFKDRKVSYNVPDYIISKILEETGKADPVKELNCTGCGYETCREKAKAVAIGKAEKEMCFEYLVEKVSSFSNLVVEETPNAIIIYQNSDVLYLNNSAKSLFSDYSNELVIDICNRFKADSSRIHELYVKSRKVYLYPKVFDLPNNGGTVVLLVDMTEMMIQKEKMNEMRKKTIQKIEEVLNDQMKLAQDIASLLGESIAETKSHFSEFKRFLGDENVDM
ncbi:MAG: [Fe-Fe] hydrogenase large subunit C-terminal domain-containing protein [Fervidobacterium sp.]|uniref:[Fe-Fe] hydrogenase large subunit C-terminal domain-containing protein n=1 Tax=Fervidobacterium sp. TaxID=1871331 RepID=UPI00404AB32F